MACNEIPKNTAAVADPFVFLCEDCGAQGTTCGLFNAMLDGQVIGKGQVNVRCHDLATEVFQHLWSGGNQLNLLCCSTVASRFVPISC